VIYQGRHWLSTLKLEARLALIGNTTSMSQRTHSIHFICRRLRKKKKKKKKEFHFAKQVDANTDITNKIS